MTVASTLHSIRWGWRSSFLPPSSTVAIWALWYWFNARVCRMRFLINLPGPLFLSLFSFLFFYFIYFIFFKKNKKRRRRRKEERNGMKKKLRRISTPFTYAKRSQNTDRTFTPGCASAIDGCFWGAGGGSEESSTPPALCAFYVWRDKEYLKKLSSKGKISSLVEKRVASSPCIIVGISPFWRRMGRSIC